MQIRKRLFLSNCMMFVVPFCVILLMAGAFYTSYQDMKLRDLGNRASDKQVIHEIEADMRQVLTSLPSEQREWTAVFESLAARMAEENYHLMVMDGSRRKIFSNCTPLDEQLLGEELEPAAFEQDSSVYILRSSNVVKYMFQHEGKEYHAVAILSRDVDAVEGRLWYIYHSYTGLLILVGLLVFLLVDSYLAHRLAQKIIRPLDALQAGARSVENGDLSVRICTDGDEEFQSLCGHFNAMAMRLQASRQSRETAENDRRMLLAGISHDLRTPLTVIRGYIEGLRDGVAVTPEMQQRYLQKIHERTVQIESLVDRLFLFSKMNLGEYPFSFQVIGLSAWLQEVARRWQQTAGAERMDIRLVLPEQAERLRIRIDRVEMERVLDNLLSNARKYHGAGRLAVEIALREQRKEIWLQVTDNGPGVAAEELPRIFLEFYRGDQARTATAKGSGLGLAIAAKVVQAHGGRIWAENHGGLRVIVALPKGELTK
ncbi:HAMP domain-containing protein [Selenomonas sp. GACV-9]|uniref:HAMP domain-containing sensor histidine kinase n=1 Tax=Selenomonas sp. GACV-9 TaxID=3158782 RepID=UPI0008E3E963|nr:HAMP domain-containing protein [Selenomonas ruminantium]